MKFPRFFLFATALCSLCFLNACEQQPYSKTESMTGGPGDQNIKALHKEAESPAKPAEKAAEKAAEKPAESPAK